MRNDDALAPGSWQKALENLGLDWRAAAGPDLEPWAALLPRAAAAENRCGLNAGQTSNRFCNRGRTTPRPAPSWCWTANRFPGPTPGLPRTGTATKPTASAALTRTGSGGGSARRCWRGSASGPSSASRKMLADAMRRFAVNRSLAWDKELPAS